MEGNGGHAGEECECEEVVDYVLVESTFEGCGGDCHFFVFGWWLEEKGILKRVASSV